MNLNNRILEKIGEKVELSVQVGHMIIMISKVLVLVVSGSSSSSSGSRSSSGTSSDSSSM